MKIAERLTLGDTLTEENLVFLKQLGASHVIVNIGSYREKPSGSDWSVRLRIGDYWEAADLVILRQMIEGAGLVLGGLASTPYSRWDKIIRGLTGRDEQIDNWCKSLRSMSAAGIQVLQYNWAIKSGTTGYYLRTSAETLGRGGALVSSFDYSLVKDKPLADIGCITDDKMWENLAYFLRVVIPAAEEYGVKMGMHPADPQVPALFGVAQIIRSEEAYKRLLAIVPSASNGITFCLGCFAQMLDADDVYKSIEYFGSQKKIFLVHFRNVKGNAENFVETYWDEGKIDMLRAMRAFHDAGFEGCLIPDHAPHATGDTKWGHRSRAFAIGYMKALMQAVTASV
jgi:mannonate dehydratase